jgi:superfamily II DNA or RNA helicase
VYLHGDSRDRDIERSRFENGDNSILIASSIYDEGTDITNVRNIVVASAFKSLRITAQRVGRGMRPHEGKSSCRIFDFMDFTNDTLLKHSRKRLSYYKKIKFTVKELAL